ncbi:DUF2935 domain-containing protein [bacterium LRH843]|nr:DUF2935 domain-containing protein [bacterium LRH843]
MNYEQSALYEHRFWLQVLGDHSRFIRNGLAPTEKEFIQTATNFIAIFDELLQISRQNNLSPSSIQTITEQANKQAEAIRSFKLALLREHLVGKITISLSPTFFNHMVNEVEEYLRILSYLIKQQAPPLVHPLHHHLLWLFDAIGHAGSIKATLDLIENQLKEKSGEFAKKFEHFYLKAVEMAGYLRTNIEQFPALDRFNQNVRLEMILFKTFLDELEELKMTNVVLGTFDVLMADHMAREECYYLLKLAESAQLEKPECDPTKPRKNQ